MEKELRTVTEILEELRLSFNIKTTTVKRPHYKYIKLNNKTKKIKGSKYTKYLGIIINQNLKQENHTD